MSPNTTMPGVIPFAPRDPQQQPSLAADPTTSLPVSPLMTSIVGDLMSAKPAAPQVQPPLPTPQLPPGTIPFGTIPFPAQAHREMLAADPYYYPITRQMADSIYDDDKSKSLSEKAGEYGKGFLEGLAGIPKQLSEAKEEVGSGDAAPWTMARLKRLPTTVAEGAGRLGEWIVETGAQGVRALRDASGNAQAGIGGATNSEEILKEQHYQRMVDAQKMARSFRGLPDQKPFGYDAQNPPSLTTSAFNLPPAEQPYSKTADVVSMALPIPGVGPAEGLVKNLARAAIPDAALLAAKNAVPKAFGAIESAAKKVEPVTQFPEHASEAIADKTKEILPKQVRAGGKLVGEWGGLAGLAGRGGALGHVLGAFKAADIARATIENSAAFAKHLAETRGDSIQPRLVQMATNPNAPAWVRTAAESLHKVGVDKAAQFATGVAGSAVKGAAAGTAIGAAMGQDPEQVGQFAAFGATLGGAGRALAKVVGNDAAARRTAMVLDAKQRFLDRATKPVDQGGLGMTLEQASRIDDFAQINAQYVHDLSNGAIKFAFHEPGEIEKQFGAAAYYDRPTKTIHLPYADPSGRILHELPHAISDALGADAKSRLLIDAAFTPQQIEAMKRQYAARMVDSKNPQSADPQAVEAMVNTLSQSGDQWIYDEIFADAGYGLLGKNAQRSGVNALPEMLGRNKILLDKIADRVRAKYLDTINDGWFDENGQPKVPSAALFSDPEVYNNDGLRKLLYEHLRQMNKRGVEPVKSKHDEAPPVGVPQNLIGKHEVAPKEWADENKVLDPKASAALDRAKAAEGKKVSEAPAKPKGDTTPDVAPRIDPVSGEKVTQGTKVSDLLDKFKHYGPYAKKMAQAIESVIGRGDTVEAWYFPVHHAGKLAKGGDLPATNPEFAPNHFLIDSKGHVLVVGLSVEAATKKIQRWEADGKLDSYWANNTDAFRKDLMQYLRNHAEGRPGETDLGGWATQKRDLLNAFIAGGQKKLASMNPARAGLSGEDRAGIVRSYRLDRISTIKPGKETGWNMEWDKKRKNFSPQVDQTKSPEFRVWRGKAKFVRAGEEYDFQTGKPVVIEAFHGTTHDFDEVDVSKGNIENDFGRGFYASTSPDDVAANYAGEGPDLTNRIERLAEQKFDQGDLKWGTPEYEKAYEEAKNVARQELTSHSGATMKVFIRLNNPLVLGGEKEPYWDYSFDDETETESGPLVDFMEALRHVASHFDDVKVEQVLEDVGVDGDTAGKIIGRALKSEGLVYATDSNGNMAGNEIVRQVLERMGFDGVIDKTVNEKFGSQRQNGKSMEGVDETTAHIIAFDSASVKSATGNRGTFDASKRDIRLSPPVDKNENLTEGNEDENARSISGRDAAASPESAASAVRAGSEKIRKEHSYRSDFGAQVEALTKLAEQTGRFFEPSVIPDKIYSDGAEHEVWINPKDGRMWKATNRGEYGASMRAGIYPTPVSYLQRLALANKVFGDDIRFEGVTRDAGKIRVITSQPFVDGGIPTPYDVRDFMQGLGFEKLPSGSAWYRAADNVLANDVRPGNVLRTDDGKCHAIDVQLDNPTPEYMKLLREWEQGRMFSPKVDDDYDSAEDFFDRVGRNRISVMQEFLDHEHDPAHRVSWTRISAPRLKKIWLDFGKSGVIRDEKGLDKIADQALENIARIKAITELVGHESYDVKPGLEDDGITLDEKQWDKFYNSDFIRNEFSDYAMRPLESLYSELFRAETPEAKLYAVDKILNVVHQRGDIADLFVQGGAKTLTEIANQGGYSEGATWNEGYKGQNDLSRRQFSPKVDKTPEIGPVWFSQLRKVIEDKMPDRAPVGHVRNLLDPSKGYGVKPDEVKWTGLDDWLNQQKGSVSKKDVLDYLKQNNVRVKEVKKSEKNEKPDIDVRPEHFTWETKRAGDIRFNERSPDPDEQVIVGHHPEDVDTEFIIRKAVPDDFYGNETHTKYVVEGDWGDPFKANSIPEAKAIAAEYIEHTLRDRAEEDERGRASWQDATGDEGNQRFELSNDRGTLFAIVEHELAKGHEEHPWTGWRGDNGVFVGRFRTLEGAQQRMEMDYGPQGRKESPGDTQYAAHSLPGGKNYREILFQMPERSVPNFDEWAESKGHPKTAIGTPGFRGSQRDELLKQYRAEHPITDIVPYKSPHWDEPNVLAHTRVDDRTDAEGRPGLFTQEIQSDWHQEGRKKGYQAGGRVATSATRGDRLWRVNDQQGNFLTNVLDHDLPKDLEGGSEKARATAIEEGNRRIKEDWHAISPVPGVPDAPFKNTWHEMVFRRLLRMAAEEGKDWLGWTTGEQQAERYDLSKQVKMISALAQPEGKYVVYIEGPDGDMFRNQHGFGEYGQKSMTPGELEELVGKDVARKVIAGADTRAEEPDEDARWYDSKPSDLKLGGEGMKGFYDKILVDYANKLGKKFGAKATTLKISTAQDSANPGHGVYAGDPMPTETIHALPVTPEMRASVMKGQALFSPKVEKGAALKFDGPETDNPAVNAFADDRGVCELLMSYQYSDPDALREKTPERDRLHDLLSRVQIRKPPTLYRGAVTKFPESGISSWTTDKKKADYFARENGGEVFTLNRPVKAVSIYGLANAWTRKHPQEQWYPGEQSEWVVLDPAHAQKSTSSK